MSRTESRPTLPAPCCTSKEEPLSLRCLAYANYRIVHGGPRNPELVEQLLAEISHQESTKS